MNLILVASFPIFVDALETFFVDSYKNGATSWIPNDVPSNVKIIVSITKGDFFSVLLLPAQI